MSDPAGVPYGIIDPDYAAVYTKARCTAWQYGFACVMHGSFTRDLDLLLVPWADHCFAEPEHIVNLIADRCDLNVIKGSSPKPHGRLAFTLTFKGFGDPRFVDISVMPTIKAEIKEAT